MTEKRSMPKICTVVIGKNLKEFLNQLRKTQQVSDMVELRVDYIEDLKISDLEIIKNQVKKEAIFTCRHKKEGGRFVGSEKERIKILERAIELGFNFVDVELSTFSKVKFLNVKGQQSIVCSWHDFKKTPSLSKLKKIRDEMRKTKVDICKIVTMVNFEEDVRRLMLLLLSKKQNEKMIVLGMGEKGKILRILSPLLGGYLTFASIGKAKSAPGQIDITELKNIYKIITLKS